MLNRRGIYRIMFIYRSMYMGDNKGMNKNKVYLERPDVVADRDAVDMILQALGYPALMSAKALESLVYRERKAKEARERACPKA